MQDHVAAPIPVTVNGKTWDFSPVVMTDLIYVLNWGKAKVKEEGKKLAEGLPVELALRVIKDAKEEADNLALGVAKFDAMLNGPEGAMQILYVSLKHKHPDATMETVKELINQAPAELFDAFAKVAGMKGADESNPFPKQN